MAGKATWPFDKQHQLSRRFQMRLDNIYLPESEWMLPWRKGAEPSHAQPLTTIKARQSAKIHEIAETLVSDGFHTVDGQAEVLNVCRSTAWFLLHSHHKASGLSARVVNRILASPRLPSAVRARTLEYVEEKASGHYGHSLKQRRRFIAQLSQPFRIRSKPPGSRGRLG